jgi:glyoxylase-like metal-dependent hydrolase (beta-lactamase superfamily II)
MAPMQHAALRAPEGCVAYLAWDPSVPEALAVDPRLDQVEALLALARERGVRIRAVIDTHTHADHLSGARRLAERAGAELLAPAGSRIAAPARRVAPGSTFKAGALDVRVLAAPGHTPDAVALHAGGALFTGDSLFLEGVGRTDFPGGSADDLLDTLQAFEALPDDTLVLPGHDYASRGEAPLGRLRAEHPVLSRTGRAERRDLVAGKGASIPDIRDFLDWNLAAADLSPLPPRAAHDRARDGSALLVDVRTRAEAAVARIPGALNVPLQELDVRAGELPKDKELVLVCRTGLRAASARSLLEARGVKATVLSGGLEPWRKLGLPLIEARPGVLPLDRQVQIGAGLMVLTGVLLGAFVSPWALMLSGFVGGGLIFAGMTGTCGLTRVLARMPWNRPPASAAAVPLCSAGGAPPASTCSAGSAPKKG